jgi:hypothetical protein
MKIKLLSLLLAAVIAANVTVYAETINTDDGKKIEFCLEDSLPQNLAVDFEPDSIIKLVFNKNVVNFSVKENNLKCISLKNDDGQVVPSELIFPDDQVEPDKKREIYIDPVENLNENTTYTVEISSDMLAKNGSTLGEAVYVSFTTLASKTQEVSETKNTEQPLQPTTEVSNISQQPEITEESTEEAEESQLKEDAALEELLKEEVFEENETEDALQSEDEIFSQTTEENEEADEKSNSLGLMTAVVVLVLISALFIAYKKTKKR